MTCEHHFKGLEVAGYLGKPFSVKIIHEILIASTAKAVAAIEAP